MSEQVQVKPRRRRGKRSLIKQCRSHLSKSKEARSRNCIPPGTAVFAMLLQVCGDITHG